MARATGRAYCEQRPVGRAEDQDEQSGAPEGAAGHTSYRDDANHRRRRVVARPAHAARATPDGRRKDRPRRAPRRRARAVRAHRRTRRSGQRASRGFRRRPGISTSVIMPLYNAARANAPEIEPIAPSFTSQVGPRSEVVRLWRFVGRADHPLARPARLLHRERGVLRPAAHLRTPGSATIPTTRAATRVHGGGARRRCRRSPARDPEHPPRARLADGARAASISRRCSPATNGIGA